MKNRRLAITRCRDNSGWIVETMWCSTTGYWNCLSRTVTTTFPMVIVNRVAANADYSIHVRLEYQVTAERTIAVK